MAPVAACSRVHVSDNAVIAYLTVNADAFGVFNVDRRKWRGRGERREGCLVRIATCDACGLAAALISEPMYRAMKLR